MRQNAFWTPILGPYWTPIDSRDTDPFDPAHHSLTPVPRPKRSPAQPPSGDGRGVYDDVGRCRAAGQSLRQINRETGSARATARTHETSPVKMLQILRFRTALQYRAGQAERP